MKELHFLTLSILVSVCVSNPCANDTPRLPTKLAKPLVEQVGFGISGDPLIVRVSWPPLPSDLRPCLKGLHLLQQSQDGLSWQVTPANDANHVDARVTADENESFSLVAELDSGVKIVSGRTRFRAVDCRKERPTMEKLKAKQVAPGKLGLSWTLSGTNSSDCRRLHFYSLQYFAGAKDYNADDKGFEVLTATEEEAEVGSMVVEVPMGKVVGFRSSVGLDDPTLMNQTWFKSFIGEQAVFKSTEEGGCDERHRRPKFLGRNAEPVISLKGNQVSVSWQHLQVSYPDCVESFVVQFDGDGEDAQTAVAAGAREADVEIKNLGSGSCDYTFRVFPSWNSNSWSRQWDGEDGSIKVKASLC